MNELPKSNWRIDYGNDLSIETLRASYSPPNKFRVSRFRYPAGTTINGSMRAGKCFALSGSFTYIYDNCKVTLNSGEWTALPAGRYRLSVAEDCDAELVLVWEIQI